MKLPGHDILKIFARERELELGEVAKHVPKRFNDHRDWHVVATLYSGGYLTSDLRRSSDLKLDRNDEIAETFYTMNFGPGQFTYRGTDVINSLDPNEVHLICAAKTDLYFAERSEKRIDTFVSILVGVLIAIVTAYATAYYTAVLK